MDLNKIPFLENVDFSNPLTKKKAFLIVVAALSAIGLIIYIVATSSGDEPASTKDEVTTVAPSLPIQLGEDNDQLAENSNRSIYNASKRGSLMDELFPSEEEKKEDNSSDEDPLGKMGSGEATSDLQKQQQDIANGFNAILNGDKTDVFGTPAEKSEEEKAEEEEEKARKTALKEAQRRQKEIDQRNNLIDMGIDPDTGQYVGTEEAEKKRNTTAASSAASSAGNKKQSSSKSSKKAASSTQTPPPAQTPEPVQEKKPEQTNVEVSLPDEQPLNEDDMFGVGTVDIGSITDNKKRSDQIAIKVMFAEEKKVKSGDRIQIRLREENGFILNGVHIPKNTLLFANVTIGDRIYIKVSSLNINGQILPFNYEAYDNDGERGIYCPTSQTQETIENVAQQAENIASTALQSTMRTYGARMVSIFSSEANKKVQSAYLSSGYAFYLMASN